MKLLKILVMLAVALTFTGCERLGFHREHIEPVASVEGDHPLVGIWEWTESETWLYIFNADGNGSSGFSPLIEHFTWEICNDGHLTLAFCLGNNVVAYEHWYMQFENNILLLTDRDDNSRRHSYIRRAGS